MRITEQSNKSNLKLKYAWEFLKLLYTTELQLERPIPACLDFIFNGFKSV